MKCLIRMSFLIRNQQWLTVLVPRLMSADGDISSLFKFCIFLAWDHQCVDRRKLIPRSVISDFGQN